MGDLPEANRMVDKKILIEELGWKESDVTKIRAICIDLQNRRRK